MVRSAADAGAAKAAKPSSTATKRFSQVLTIPPWSNPTPSDLAVGSENRVGRGEFMLDGLCAQRTNFCRSITGSDEISSPQCLPVGPTGSDLRPISPAHAAGQSRLCLICPDG